MVIDYYTPWRHDFFAESYIYRHVNPFLTIRESLEQDRL